MRLSVDDGCASDIRLADLAEKYEIETIFYWPVEWHSLAHDNGYEPLAYDEALKIASSHEIGSHTITHRHLTKLSIIESFKEIIGSQFMLKRMFNQPITKFAAPRGYMNDQLTEFASNFYKSQRLTKGKGLVHVHPDSGANGNRPWLDCVTEETEELWCHSWELDKYNLWDELEAFLNGRSRS